MTTPDWTDAHGAITAYDDIPAEYLTGLANGKLGEWLQEVYEKGWDIIVMDDLAEISASPQALEYTGTDDDTRRVDIMLTRAYLAWREREG